MRYGSGFLMHANLMAFGKCNAKFPFNCCFGRCEKTFAKVTVFYSPRYKEFCCINGLLHCCPPLSWVLFAPVSQAILAEAQPVPAAQIVTPSIHYIPSILLLSVELFSLRVQPTQLVRAPIGV